MEVLSADLRPKSEKKGRYESVVQMIREKHGGLETMRAKLGFTQKQMSELLLVDPSAWTRWVRDGESAPAHIYQALAWYFESREATRAIVQKVDWSIPYVASPSVVTTEAWEQEKAALIAQWHESQKKTVGVSDGWKLFLLVNSVALLYIIVAQLL